MDEIEGWDDITFSNPIRNNNPVVRDMVDQMIQNGEILPEERWIYLDELEVPTGEAFYMEKEAAESLARKVDTMTEWLDVTGVEERNGSYVISCLDRRTTEIVVIHTPEEWESQRLLWSL